MKYVICVLFLVIVAAKSNESFHTKISELQSRVKRAPFDWDFLKMGFKDVEKTVHDTQKHFEKVYNDMKKDVDKHVQNTGAVIREHVDKVKTGGYNKELEKPLNAIKEGFNTVTEGYYKEVEKPIVDWWNKAKSDVEKAAKSFHATADKAIQGTKKLHFHEQGDDLKQLFNHTQISIMKAYGDDIEGKADIDNRMNLPDTVTQKPICKLPTQLLHGTFVSIEDNVSKLYIIVTCNYGYRIVGSKNVYCNEGVWSDKMPTCERFCEVPNHPSVEYTCHVPDTNLTRDCEHWVANKTVIIPECRYPNYYNTTELNNMICVDGFWDRATVCQAVCGKVTPMGEELAAGGWRAERGEFPWHVGIYRNDVTPYMQICGGSIVTTKLVISAAHCFWSDAHKQLSASLFAVAAGKLYRPWNDKMDADVQKSNVTQIIMKKTFRGVESNFQEDLALVILKEGFVYQTYVRPICVDFDTQLNNKQMFSGSIGKVAGWGLTTANGNPSQVLRVVNLEYVEIEDCIRESPPQFQEYLTIDKFCAGYKNGTTLCKGDSGGGLVFADRERGFDRYYLRGVVSTSPKSISGDKCNMNAITAFTEIFRYAAFIRPQMINYL